MGSVAASGGYFIPMACQHIVALPSTLTGSIGVISARFSAGELLAKLGIWTDVRSPQLWHRCEHILHGRV